MSSKYSDQPVHSPSMAKILFYPSLDNLEAVESICDQRRLGSDCADGRTSLIEDFCRATAHSIDHLLLFNMFTNCWISEKRCTIWIYTIYSDMLVRICSVYTVGKALPECLLQFEDSQNNEWEKNIRRDFCIIGVNDIVPGQMNRDVRNRTFGHVRPVKIRTRLRIQTVRSE